jgi:hypothetical protein
MQRLDTRAHFRQRKWLLQVVIRAQTESPQPSIQLAPSREDQHRRSEQQALAQVVEDLEAIRPRQTDIQDDRVPRL